MAGKATKSAPSGTFGTFDLLMPRKALVAAGLTFERGNFVRITGAVPRYLQAARLSGGSIGVHAAGSDADVSLCRCSLVSATKSGTLNKSDSGARERVAQAVTCRFCAARLVSAGLLTAETLNKSMSEAHRAYALEYGGKSATAALAEIEERTAAATRKSKRAPSKPKSERKPKSAPSKSARKSKASA